jgi:hypothetical protein
VLLAWTNNDLPIGLQMNFSTGMFVTEEAVGDDWDWVTHIVHPKEVGDLRVEECRPVLISNTRRPKCDTSNIRACRQIKLHEQRIELRKSPAKRVTDLQRQHEGSRYERPDYSYLTMETYQNHSSRRILGHQLLDLYEDLARCDLVLVRKPGVDLDGSRDAGKESRIGSDEDDVRVSPNSQAVKYLVCWESC